MSNDETKLVNVKTGIQADLEEAVRRETAAIRPPVSRNAQIMRAAAGDALFSLLTSVEGQIERLERDHQNRVEYEVERAVESAIKAERERVAKERANDRIDENDLRLSHEQRFRLKNYAETATKLYERGLVVDKLRAEVDKVRRAYDRLLKSRRRGRR